MDDRSQLRLSRVAVWLLGALAPQVDREAIVGDAIESVSAAPSRRAANRELRRQVLRSAPYLVLRRIQANRTLALAFLLAVVYPLILLWWELAFGLFRLLYTTNIFQGSIGLALSARMLLESSGYLAAGVAAAWLQRKLAIQLGGKVLLLVAWLVLAGPTAVALLLGTAKLPMVYLLARILLAAPLAALGFNLGTRPSRG